MKFLDVARHACWSVHAFSSYAWWEMIEHLQARGKEMALNKRPFTGHEAEAAH